MEKGEAPRPKTPVPRVQRGLEGVARTTPVGVEVLVAIQRVTRQVAMPLAPSLAFFPLFLRRLSP